ncbi:LuxR family transcriptional regulator, partial [uncultured Jatrophihabitans sp.]|uniref:LuxR family transcriptional regulator n=1 Tax=uncultured Jatrophihabitans sp. TaxID=1610747 RepID=UPI0035CBE113
MTVVRARPLAERLEAVTASCADVDALARAIFDAVAEYVPFAFACLATTDPASELITRAIKSHPLEIGDDEFAAAEYGAPDINQFAELARRPVPVGVLSVDTDGHPDSCRRFRDYMAPVFGFTDELRLACRARNTTWGAFAIYRGPGEPAFTERDGELLGSVHELMALRLQRALFAPNTGAQGEAGAAVLIVDADNRVTDMTAAVEAQIDELGGWDNGSLPANLVTVTAAARASRQPARTRVLGRTGRWLAVQAMPLDGADGRR